MGSTGDGKICFVIMPFGEKKHPISGVPIDFDKVHHQIIQTAVQRAELTAVRSDEESLTGLIHRDMIRRIMDSAVAIVDITTGNPNVMYELGVRHTARRWGTIIIRQRGHDAIPFNIAGLRALDYDLSTPETIEDSIQHLAAQIKACLNERNVDSLVHTLFNGLNVSRRAMPLVERKTYFWHVAGKPEREFCIVTGDIQHVDMVDLWVNPENTKMQLGRFHDNSVSSYIRYWGAKLDVKGAVVRDHIHDALASRIATGQQVEPATVIVTRPGHLRYRNGVQAVLHVAAQHGEPGKGYTTIRSHMDCVFNALEAADKYNEGWQTKLKLRPVAKSIIFPLFGTRGSGDDPQSITTDIVHAAKIYMQNWPQSKVERVYFLAYTDRDEELCLTAFQRLHFVFSRAEPEGEAVDKAAEPTRATAQPVQSVMAQQAPPASPS
jgi:O-acetyl-ADP-ribose deacetylase (regulator of RNase III)